MYKNCTEYIIQLLCIKYGTDNCVIMHAIYSENIACLNKQIF